MFETHDFVKESLTHRTNFFTFCADPPSFFF